MKKISVTDLKQKLVQKEDFLFIDVREKDELAIASIDGATHIPLMTLPQKVEELDKTKETVIMCHSGVRSAQACLYLDTLGFDTYNVEGGIHAWSKDVDSKVKMY
tara:strand:- start:3967 stop:4281 length:315 start_codon:yes stop_codon:yes gene_type:complete